MNTEAFCTWLRAIRDKHISRREFSKIYPWHENTIKGYDKDRLPDVDYLYAVHQVSGYPFWDIIEKRLSAGILDLKPGDLKLSFQPTSAAKLASKSNLYKMADDSMEPTVRIYALYEFDENEKEFSEGKLYAFRIRQNITIRRVQFDLTGNILLTADNKKYETLTVKKEEVKQLDILGKVVMVNNPM
ncbi:S24 family peptidase [Alteromonas confluentis]|uniref:Peptidase S24/S26A/S26B/S26C domain-containing protein n=1 Tax=Alteromonas confluentis TaxID=1656094 RepID=A0A1E7ZE28_9ALTE|nr:S24 family peptidase [Alteromonas confluentis]OFC71778.1 hypothetical protein BFC18_06390 [Alteromonas confluentis]